MRHDETGRLVAVVRSMPGASQHVHGRPLIVTNLGHLGVHADIIADEHEGRDAVDDFRVDGDGPRRAQRGTARI